MNIKKNLLFRKYEIYQRENGYRYGLDPILLSTYLRSLKLKGEGMEVGFGSLIVSLSLCLRDLELLDTINYKIDAIELQESQFEIGKINNENCETTEYIKLLKGNFLNLESQKKYDFIFSNPPYFKVGKGMESPNEEIDISKREVCLNLESLVKKSKSLLKESGSLILIYPVNRLSEVIFEMEKNKIRVKALVIIASKENFGGTFFIVHGQKGFKGELKVLPQITIYNKNNAYTEQGKRILEEGIME